MDADRIIPEGGRNPYSDHPGFCASACPKRITITPANIGSTSTRHGFACYETGGHCIPGTVEYCKDHAP